MTTDNQNKSQGGPDKAVKKEPAKMPEFKRGQVTIEGVNFNDAWTRTKSEKEFIDAFIGVHYQDKSPENRREILAMAYQACLAAK